MTFRCWLLGHGWYDLPVDNGLVPPWGLIARRCRRCGVLSDTLQRTDEPNPPTTRNVVKNAMET